MDRSDPLAAHPIRPTPIPSLRPQNLSLEAQQIARLDVFSNPLGARRHSTAIRDLNRH